VVASLQEFNAVGEDVIHEAIRFIDPSGPDAATEVLQRFWFADAVERISETRFHQVEHSERGLAVGVDPMAEILQAPVLDDGPSCPLRSRTQDFASSVRRSAVKSIGLVRPCRARVSAASNRTAFSGERSK